MNFENFKSNWKNEEQEDNLVSDSLVLVSKSNHPVSKIKSNMRQEFGFQVICLLILCVLPLLLDFRSSTIKIYYINYAVIAVISSYFLLSFYRFYRSKLNYFSANSKDSLNLLYTELRLMTERYRCFAFVLLPFTILCFLIGLYERAHSNNLPITIIDDNNLLYVIIVVVVFTVVSMLGIAAWQMLMYDRYITKIKEILDALSDR